MSELLRPPPAAQAEHEKERSAQAWSLLFYFLELTIKCVTHASLASSSSMQAPASLTFMRIALALIG